MIQFARSCLLYVIINSLRTALPITIQDWPKNDVIIDINKGYALHRVGVYSPDIVEEIIHTFIPLSMFCIASPQTDICQYTAAPINKKIVLLATMLSSHNDVHKFTSYDSESVSILIEKDILRVLAEHHPENVIKHSQSIVHFTNNKFFYDKNVIETMTTSTPINRNEDNLAIVRLHADSTGNFLKQINNNINKVGFEFLSDKDLRSFLMGVFSTIDNYYLISNIQESLDTFLQLVVGQSIFALRFCSLNQQKSLPLQPCIVISTVFLRIRPGASSVFSIYRLVPLPVIYNHELYTYANLPKIIGIDLINEKIITWNEETDKKQCIFSHLVVCRTLPMPMLLTKSGCLYQLLDSTQTATKMCEVKRSKNIERDAYQIDTNFWIFFNIPRLGQCHISSSSDDTTESVFMNEPALISVPCGKSFTCADSRVLPIPCRQRRALITPRISSNVHAQAPIFVPIRKMTETIISSYESQFQDTINELMTTLSSKQSFKQMLSNMFTYIASTIIIVLMIACLCVVKFLQYKFKRDVDKIGSTIETILSL